MPSEIERLRARQQVLRAELRALPDSWSHGHKVLRERDRLASKLRHVEARIFKLTQMRLAL
jgi:hypothetical protein